MLRGLLFPVDEPEMIPKINSKLPVDIRVQEVKRVTKNFNSKVRRETSIITGVTLYKWS